MAGHLATSVRVLVACSTLALVGATASASGRTDQEARATGEPPSISAAAPDTLTGPTFLIWVDRVDQQEVPPKLLLSGSDGQYTELILPAEILVEHGGVLSLDRKIVRAIGRLRGTSPRVLDVQELQVLGDVEPRAR